MAAMPSDTPSDTQNVELVLVSHSAALVAGLRELVAQMAGPSVTIHAVGGLEDGSLVEARSRHGRLVGDESLMLRARLVVAAGETVSSSEGMVAASLDGSPITVARTLMRACSRVLRVEVRLR